MIGQANVSNWAELSITNMLKMIDFQLLVIFSEILVKQAIA